MNITALLQRFINAFSATVRTSVPAKIISFDPNNLTVNVQVAIQGIKVSKNGTLRQLDTGERVLGEDFNLSPLINVPVSMLWQNNYGITVPIKEGDFGLLIVCDRDISQFKKSQDISSQASLRKFDLNDSIFLPFLPKRASIGDYNLDAVEVRFSDTKLSVAEDGVNITGNLTVSGEVTIGEIPFSTHKHPYLNVSTPSTTGTPTA